MGRAHAGKLCSDQPVGFLPGNLHECVRPAFVTRRARATFQPALAHHRRGDPAGVIQQPDNARRDRRRIAVLLEGVQRLHLPVFRLDPVGAPMRAGQRQIIHVNSPGNLAAT